jgi:hypothetical protein
MLSPINDKDVDPVFQRGRPMIKLSAFCMASTVLVYGSTARSSDLLGGHPLATWSHSGSAGMIGNSEAQVNIAGDQGIFYVDFDIPKNGGGTYIFEMHYYLSGPNNLTYSVIVAGVPLSVEFGAVDQKNVVLRKEVNLRAAQDGSARRATVVIAADGGSRSSSPGLFIQSVALNPKPAPPSDRLHLPWYPSGDSR